MSIENKLVVHPTLGICMITDRDQKNEKVTLTAVSDQGCKCTFPMKSFKLIGIRDLITKEYANELVDSIYHPAVAEFDKDKMSPRKIEEVIKGKEISDKAFLYSYLLYQKYTKERIGSINSTYLQRVEENLCEELSFVLSLNSEEMIKDLICSYKNMIH